jgi:NADPH:quinone reductase-like Zn-dependent oxidoreductase
VPRDLSRTFTPPTHWRTWAGLVHTAAASQLGQMLVKLCKEEDMNLINVVRREEQAETLRGLGAKYVVVTQG